MSHKKSFFESFRDKITFRDSNFKYGVLEGISPIIGFLIAFAILMIIVVIVGESPAKAFGAIFKYSLGFGSNMTFKMVITKIATLISVASPLFITGLAVAIAFQAGVFNIGVEGQYFFGGLIGAVAGIY
ncbi:MAG: hypothetical protein MJB14_10330, partial [Spirochaetes bacterium]|nr:hypothetical protein [Spirochaetota bacterium]